jgi:hypothetical protein
MGENLKLLILETQIPSTERRLEFSAERRKVLATLVRHTPEEAIAALIGVRSAADTTQEYAP